MNNIINETLPANSVDLDKASIFTLACDIMDEGLGCAVVDAVVESGCVGYIDANGHTTHIHWGKTATNEYGNYDVVVDLPKIDLPHIQCLWVAGVIDGEFPSIRNG